MKRKLSGNALVVPSADIGPEPQLLWIAKELIQVDKRYQREISSKGVAHVNGILRDFQWKYFQVVTVTPVAGGKYAAIDGQHRWLAALRHPLVKKLPCVVIAKADVQEQARVFEALNGKRLGITSLQRHHVGVAAGVPLSMRLDYLCAEAGLTVLKTVPQGGAIPACSLVSVATIAKFFKHSDAFLLAVLGAMVEAWPERPNGFRAANVAACVHCAVEIGDKYSRKVMVRTLKYWNEHEEFLRAYTERSENGGRLERLLAKRMVKAYRETEIM